MAYCLAKSLNIGAYDLMSRIGPKKTAEFAHLCGIQSNIPIVPSIALGTADLELLEMLQAYTMFPNKGFNTEPIFMNRIEDKNGNILEAFEPESKQIISEADAYTMYKMMQGVVDFGTGHAMRGRFGINGQMGGKTGTTQNNTDGWFIGYTPQLIAGVWVGCDDEFLRIKWTNGGNEMAMPEWAYFMQKVYADKKLGIDPKAEFTRPAELDTNPIYADQNFSAIIQKGEGSENEDQGNGNAGDYEGSELASPVESEFKKDQFKDINKQYPGKGADEYKDIMQPAEDKKTEEKKAEEKKNVPVPEDKKDMKLSPVNKPEDKNKKPPEKKPVKANEY